MREQTQDELRENMSNFERLFEKIRELNRNNDNLRAKYKGDSKFARTHKRIKERKLISNNDVDIYNVLMNAKNSIDERVAKSENIVSNTGYFDDLVMQQVAQSFHDAKVQANYDALEVTRQQIAKEYENEYDNTGVYA
jgi:type I restriction enzyme R subunit